jgi:deazaflavin-dependent oxidoreductase (nitroreductase family)
MTESYQRPGWFTSHVANPLMSGLARLGLSIRGSRVLEVKGRKSGVARRVPVNPLNFDGARYLVAPRGNTQWVRNLRASGGGTLILGRRREDFTAVEVPEDQRPRILREYLRHWKAETGVFFGGVGPDAPEEELARISPEHPVFRISAG